MLFILAAPRNHRRRKSRVESGMSDSLRYFFIEDNDAIVAIPKARFDRVFTGQGRAPRYAGKSVRVAEFGVELVHRSPTGRYRASFYVIHFDAAGKADQSQLLEHAKAALDATSSAVLEESARKKDRDKRDSNVIQASSKFAQRRMSETYGWTPGLQLRKKLVDLAMGVIR